MNWLDKTSYTAGVISGSLLVLAIIFIVKILVPLIIAILVFGTIYILWMRHRRRSDDQSST